MGAVVSLRYTRREDEKATKVLSNLMGAVVSLRYTRREDEKAHAAIQHCTFSRLRRSLRRPLQKIVAEGRPRILALRCNTEDSLTVSPHIIKMHYRQRHGVRERTSTQETCARAFQILRGKYCIPSRVSPPCPKVWASLVNFIFDCA